MSNRIVFLLFIMLSLRAHSNSDLKFELEKNGADLIGPYLKYNFLEKPYSFGNQKISNAIFGIEEIVSSEDSKNTRAELLWPKFLGAPKRLEVVYLMDKKEGRRRFARGKHFVYSRFRVPSNLYKRVVKADFMYFCLFYGVHKTVKKICSDQLARKDGKWVQRNPSGAINVTYNGKKAPRNAQISLSREEKEYELHIRYKSGFSIYVRERIADLALSSVIYDYKNRSLGVEYDTENESGFLFRTVKSYLSKARYYDKKRVESKSLVKSESDSEIEFPYYSPGFPSQFYGLSLGDTPQTDFKFGLAKGQPIATYKGVIVLRGEKPPEMHISSSEGSMEVSEEEDAFSWEFQVKNKGQYNKSYIELEQKNGEKFFFSKKIYRGYQASVALNGSLTASFDGATVFGYTGSADFWPETIWNDHSFFKQRWGMSVNHYQNLNEFTDSKTKEKFSLDWQSIDLMARFHKGVRPLQSSFGLGLRSAYPQVSRPGKSRQAPSLLGIGLFWHTAPQKIVDNLFNTVSFFRYPKWMELSLYYYPVVFGSDFSLGFTVSYHARGRLMFSRNWFLDASINITSLDINNKNNFDTKLSSVFGTIGIGYFF